MNAMLILQFIVLTAVVTGTIIFFLHRVLIASTDGAVKRLNTETEAVRTKRSELDRKIKEAEEELAKRKKEAEDLAKKMKEEAEEGARAEREKMVKKAREEGEEIIAKAQHTKDQLREEIRKELTLKIIDYSAQLLTAVLSGKTKGALNAELVDEFLVNLEKMDMSQVDADLNSADIVCASPLSVAAGDKLSKLLKSKLNRDIKINTAIDPNIVGGVVLRFGSLALDGSLQNSLLEAGEELKKKAERGE